jgi:membrane-associated phospholipid phosphatase
MNFLSLSPMPVLLRLSVLLLGGLAFTTPALAGPTIHTEDSDRAAGDILEVALPAIGLGTALYKGDTEGMKEWTYSLGATMLTTSALKRAFNSTSWGERPNGGQNSFPSGHTSAACSGASFIGQRYGWTYGAAAMVPAAFVGYSRVDEGLHHWRDVVAGCAIGVGFSYWLVDPENKHNLSIVPEIGEHSWALGFQMNY